MSQRKINFYEICHKAVRLGLVAMCFVFVTTQQAKAHICPLSGTHCSQGDCRATIRYIENYHEAGEQHILAHMRDLFWNHREWLVRDFFESNVLPSLMLMTEQMSAVGLFQVEVVGEMFDAKLHLETQRLFNQLKNEANRDYYPVESFCAFGTNVRSLSASERIAHLSQGALEQKGITRLMGTVGDNAASDETLTDKRGRWQQFVSDNCDPNDNNRDNTNTGLVPACGTGAADMARTNRDVEYTRFIYEPRVLNVNFRDGQITPEEEDIFLMMSNLYGHDVPRRDLGYVDRKSGQALLIRERSVQAKRSVAMNTFNAIVGMKTAGSGESNSAEFLRAIVQDMGMSDEDIEHMLGESPSYYAQLEILSKLIFQNVDFITELYDKPVNIDRKAAALNAIELILDRAIYESELRHEMLYSVLLSSYLEADAMADYDAFVQAVKNSRR